MSSECFGVQSRKSFPLGKEKLDLKGMRRVFKWTCVSTVRYIVQ